MEGLFLLVLLFLSLSLLRLSASPDCHQMRALVRAEFPFMTRGQLVESCTIWPRADLETQLSQSVNKYGGKHRVERI